MSIVIQSLILVVVFLIILFGFYIVFKPNKNTRQLFTDINLAAPKFQQDILKKYGDIAYKELSEQLDNQELLYSEADMYRFGIEVEKESTKEFRHYDVLGLLQKYRIKK